MNIIKIIFSKMKYIFTPIDYIIFVLCNPLMWFSIETSSKKVNAIVNKLIQQYNEGKLTIFAGEYNARFTFKNGAFIDVWIENFPYAYGKIHDSKGVDISSLKLYDNLPYRYTRIKLHRLIKKVKKQQKHGTSNEIANVIDKLEKLGG